MANDETVRIGKELLGALYGQRAVNETFIAQPAHSTSEEITPHKELLPPIDLETPIYFAGKTYVGTGATDHVADPIIADVYNRKIMGSMWTGEFIYTNNQTKRVVVDVGDFSTLRPKIFSGVSTNLGYMQFNIKWCTEGDWRKQQGLEVHTARIFPNTEARVIKKEELLSLTSQGYGIFSTIAQLEHFMWIPGEKHRIPHNSHGRTVTDGVERFRVEGTEPNLWSDIQWLQNDTLIAGIADAYLQIMAGKTVYMTKPDKGNPLQSVKIAEALTHMIAAKIGKLINWCTERDFLEDFRFNLLFIGENRINFPREDKVLVNLEQSRINSENQQTVAAMRKAFAHPLPAALEIWKNL